MKRKKKIHRDKNGCEFIKETYFIGGKMKFHKIYLVDGIPADEFYERLEGFSLEIYYESIYGEKWKFDGTTTKLENFNGLPEEEQFR